MNSLRQTYVGFLAAVVDFCRRHSISVLVAAAILTAFSVYFAATRFAISTDTSGMLSRDLPFERLQHHFDRDFPQINDTIAVVVKGQSPGLSRAAADRLASWLRAHGVGINSLYQPGGGKFFEEHGLMYLSSQQIWKLSDRLSRAQPFLARLSREPTVSSLVTVIGQALARARPGNGETGLRLLFHYLGTTLRAQEAGTFYQLPWGSLIAGSGGGGSRLNFIIIKPHYDFHNVRPVQVALDSIRLGTRVLHLTPANGVTVEITGSAALDNAQFETVSRSAGIAVGLSIALVLVLLALALKTGRLVFCTLVTLFAGLSWTAAFALAATGPFNLISIAFAVLFVGLGVDFGIQFCMRYREERRGADHPVALARTVSGIGFALTLAGLAAAISFYSFVPTHYAGIRDLGIISGTSMFIGLAANFTVLPALLTVMGLGRMKEHRFKRGVSLERVPVHRNVRAILVISGLIALGTIPLVLSARFDFDPMHLQDAHNEAVRTFQELLRRGRPSPYPINLLEPDLASATRVARRLARLPDVEHALTLASFVPAHQGRKLAIIQQLALVSPVFALQPTGPVTSDPQAVRTALEHLQQHLAGFLRDHPRSSLVPEARRLRVIVDGYLARYGASPPMLAALGARIIGALPAQLAILRRMLAAGPVTLDTLPASLRSRYIAPDGHARVEVLSRIPLDSNRNLRRFTREVQRVAPEATGAPVLLVEGGDAVVQAFRESILISVVLIAALLLLALRRVADVLMVLVPIAFAAMLTVALMQIAGISFNLANIIVLPLEIGLCVAFGIYFVMRWRDGINA
ncbi:MAG: MMPL family transporter, partial [Acidiferrobacteraceae bacterium]